MGARPRACPGLQGGLWIRWERDPGSRMTTRTRAELAVQASHRITGVDPIHRCGDGGPVRLGDRRVSMEMPAAGDRCAELRPWCRVLSLP